MKRVYKHSDTIDYKKRLSEFFNASAVENLPAPPNDHQSRFAQRKRSSVLLRQSDFDENLRSKHMLNLELEDENLGYYSLTHKVKLLISENSWAIPGFAPCKSPQKFQSRRPASDLSLVSQNDKIQERNTVNKKHISAVGMLTRYRQNSQDSKTQSRNQKTERAGRNLNETQLSQLNYQNYQILKEESFMKTLQTEKARAFSGTKVLIEPVIVGSQKIDIMAILEATLKSQPMAKSLNNFFSVWTLFSQLNKDPKKQSKIIYQLIDFLNSDASHDLRNIFFYSSKLRVGEKVKKFLKPPPSLLVTKYLSTKYLTFIITYNILMSILPPVFSNGFDNLELHGKLFSHLLSSFTPPTPSLVRL